NLDQLVMAVVHELVHIFLDPFQDQMHPHLSMTTTPAFMDILEQQTQKLTMQFLRLAPLTFPTNPNNDPAFYCADWVKQMILSPPFGWRWNRTDATPQVPTFVTIPGQPDYPVSL